MTAVSVPLLVTGPARSGASLVARMLSGHPEVEVADEPLGPLLPAIRAALAPGVGDADAPGPPDGYGSAAAAARLHTVVTGTLAVPADRAALQTLRPILAAVCADGSPDLTDLASGLAGHTYAELVAGFLRAVGSRRGVPPGSVVGVTQAWAADLVPAWLRGLRTSRAILVRRDPRDVLASALDMVADDPTGVPHPLSVLRQWRTQEAIAAWIAHRPELAHRVLVVRVEDLTATPAAVTHALASFLGVADDGSMRLPVREPNPLTFPLIERRGRLLSPERVAMVEAVCGPEMDAVGYRVETGEHLDPVIAMAKLVDADHRCTWSWRSGGGDPAHDVALEVARGILRTAPEGALPADLERAMYLFAEARRAVAGRSPAVAAA